MHFHRDGVCIRRAFAGPRLIAALGALAFGGGGNLAASSLDFPPALQPASLISAEELLISTQKLLPKGAFLGPLLDARYAVVKHDWLVRSFIPSYRRAVETLRKAADGGGEEGADCDDFGMFLRHMAGLAGMLAGSAQPAAAKVIVLQERSFSGVSRTRERHAIGLFLTEKGWFVLEPQNAASLVSLKSYANRDRIQYITFH